MHPTPDHLTPDVGNPDYDALPEPVKQLHPFESWQWLSGEEKARLVQDECEPEF